jgi:hypothetical protein
MAKDKVRPSRIPWIDCRLFDDLAEAYLARNTEYRVAAALEAHYFGCDACADRLLTLRSLQVALQERRAAIRKEPWAARPLLPARFRSVASRAGSLLTRLGRRGS